MCQQSGKNHVYCQTESNVFVLSKLISTALNLKSKVNDVKSIDLRSKLSTALNLKLKVNDLKSIDSKSTLESTTLTLSTQSSFS